MNSVGDELEATINNKVIKIKLNSQVFKRYHKVDLYKKFLSFPNCSSDHTYSTRNSAYNNNSSMSDDSTKDVGAGDNFFLSNDDNHENGIDHCSGKRRNNTNQYTSDTNNEQFNGDVFGDSRNVLSILQRAATPARKDKTNNDMSNAANLNSSLFLELKQKFDELSKKYSMVNDNYNRLINNDANRSIYNLKKEKFDLLSDIKSKNEELKIMKMKNNDVNRKIDSLNAEKLELICDIKSKDKELEVLKDNNAKLIGDSQLTINNLLDRCKILQTEKNELNKKILDTKRGLKAILAENNNLRMQLENMDKRLKHLPLHKKPSSDPVDIAKSNTYQVSIPVIDNSLYLVFETSDNVRARFRCYRSFDEKENNGAKSPAESQKLIRAKGDVLVGLNGQCVRSLSYSDVIAKIRDLCKTESSVKLEFESCLVNDGSGSSSYSSVEISSVKLPQDNQAQNTIAENKTKTPNKVKRSQANNIKDNDPEDNCHVDDSASCCSSIITTLDSLDKEPLRDEVEPNIFPHSSTSKRKRRNEKTDYESSNILSMRNGVSVIKGSKNRKVEELNEPTSSMARHRRSREISSSGSNEKNNGTATNYWSLNEVTFLSIFYSKYPRNWFLITEKLNELGYHENFTKRSMVEVKTKWLDLNHQDV